MHKNLSKVTQFIINAKSDPKHFSVKTSMSSSHFQWYDSSQFPWSSRDADSVFSFRSRHLLKHVPSTPSKATHPGHVKSLSIAAFHPMHLPLQKPLSPTPAPLRAHWRRTVSLLCVRWLNGSSCTKFTALQSRSASGTASQTAKRARRLRPRPTTQGGGYGEHSMPFPLMSNKVEAAIFPQLNPQGSPSPEAELTHFWTIVAASLS